MMKIMLIQNTIMYNFFSFFSKWLSPKSRSYFDKKKKKKFGF